MSSLSFLVTELQSLASETRRRFPEVREAAEKVISALRESQVKVQEQLLQDGQPCQVILRPLLLGLGTKNSKVIGIALGSLQRLVTMKRIASSATPAIVNASKDCVNQGVDIQLKILQMLLNLAMNSPDLHGQQLSEVLYIYFKLQESRIAVVSSTAAATLRQLVMFLTGDRVTVEDDAAKEDILPVTEITLPNGVKCALKPAAWDSYLLFEDLCLLINSERGRFLHLESLSKTFALELIESILTNCHQVIRKHPEQLILLGQHLCPFLVKSLTERPAFSSTLRSIRVLFLLLKQFSDELVAETEMFMTMLLRMISGESEDDSTRPYWFRVIALEIIRGLCKDAEFMRKIHGRYDAQASRSPVFASLVNTLNRVISEKPALLGVSTKIFGVGVGESAGSALDVGHIVASAASVTAGMVGMTGQEVGLSIFQSGMKVQCIDQLDKVDAPAIPDTYVFLLALQSFVSLIDGFATLVLPLHHLLMVQKRRNPNDKAIRAPPAFDLSKFPDEVDLLRVNSMIESTWHGFLAALSFIISTRLSDELFSEVLVTYQALLNVSGALGLVTTRDALLTGLSKFAIPPAVVTALESYAEPATPRPSGVGAIADNLGLSGGANTPPGLSDRNIACLKILLDCSLYLAGSLGSSWFSVLETLQNAECVLISKVGTTSGSRRSSTHGPPSIAQSSSPTSKSTLSTVSEAQFGGSGSLLSDLDVGSMQLHIHRLFEATRSLEDEAFQDFILALCKLSREMVQMQVTSGLASRSTSASDLLSPATEQTHRRRASGIHIPKTTRSGDFGISKLGLVCSLNVVRLIYRAPQIAWTPFTEHLLGIILSPVAPSAIRVQAARCLDDVIAQVPKNVTSGAAKELQSDIQSRVFDVLKRQNEVDTFDTVATAELEVRRLCLETLHLILQGSLFTLVTGWDKIFGILSSVCATQAIMSPAADSEAGSSKGSSSLKPRPPPLQSLSGRGGLVLIRIAFQSVTLICDALTQLDASELQLCIRTLGLFGMQGDTNIALTAAASLLWNVSDVIQSRRKDTKDTQQFDELWMTFLKELLGLCPDPRPEVRDGSVQTLFRSLQLYGQSLSLELWDRCFQEVIFPLLYLLSSSLKASTDGRDAWDSSKALAFTSLGSIFKEFMVPKLYPIVNFEAHWKAIVGEVEKATVEDNNIVTTAALKTLTGALLASHQSREAERTHLILEETWQFVLRVGEHLNLRSSATSSSPPAYNQESLLALVEVIKALRTEKGREWETEKLARLLPILKNVMSYSSSPEYRPDVDNTTPLQTSIMSIMKSIDVSEITTARLVIADVAEYLTLAFVAAFDLGLDTNSSTNGPPRSSKRKLTYVAVSKESMPLLVDLISKSVSQDALYSEGTIEKAFGAFAIPMKLKYDCPPSSKLNKDPPLWKSATTCFLNVLKLFLSHVGPLREGLSKECQESIWHQIAESFSGALLADCSAVESWSREDRDAEELFDQALLTTLEQDVLPQLGHETVPDHVLARFVKVLQQASQVCAPQLEDTDPSPSGTAQDFPLATRERFAYSCFDLLFDMCASDRQGPKGKDSSQVPAESRRISAFALLPLITRCRAVLSSFIADEELRKGIPFSRAREEEILYVLHRMLSLRIWPGCLLAAYSSDPSQYSNELPKPSLDTQPTALLSDAMKRGPRAHLFQIYPLLCKIAYIKHEGPVAWMPVPSNSPLVGVGLPPTPTPSPHSRSSAIEPSTQTQAQQPDAESQGSQDRDKEKEGQVVVRLDAKELAARCLEELGKEMGLIHG